jgi:hypothetical protein
MDLPGGLVAGLGQGDRCGNSGSRRRPWGGGWPTGTPRGGGARRKPSIKLSKNKRRLTGDLEDQGQGPFKITANWCDLVQRMRQKATNRPGVTFIKDSTAQRGGFGKHRQFG